MKQASKNEMFAHRNDGGGFDHIYSSALAVGMCGVPDGEIVPVRIVPDSEGTYWCWHDFEHDEYCMVWPTFMQLDICFAYGIEAAEKRGGGIRTQVRVELV